MGMKSGRAWANAHLKLRALYDERVPPGMTQKLGLTLRHAFNTSDEFEALLGALVDGLSPKPNQPF